MLLNIDTLSLYISMLIDQFSMLIGTGYIPNSIDFMETCKIALNMCNNKAIQMGNYCNIFYRC